MNLTHRGVTTGGSDLPLDTWGPLKKLKSLKLFEWFMFGGYNKSNNEIIDDILYSILVNFCIYIPIVKLKWFRERAEPHISPGQVADSACKTGHAFF